MAAIAHSDPFRTSFAPGFPFHAAGMVMAEVRPPSDPAQSWWTQSQRSQLDLALVMATMVTGRHWPSLAVTGRHWPSLPWPEGTKDGVRIHRGSRLSESGMAHGAWRMAWPHSGWQTMTNGDKRHPRIHAQLSPVSQFWGGHLLDQGALVLGFFLISWNTSAHGSTQTLIRCSMQRLLCWQPALVSRISWEMHWRLKGLNVQNWTNGLTQEVTRTTQTRQLAWVEGFSWRGSTYKVRKRSKNQNGSWIQLKSQGSHFNAPCPIDFRGDASPDSGAEFPVAVSPQPAPSASGFLWKRQP